MSVIAFDTLEATKTLRSAGVEERTAEAIVAVVQRTVELPPTDHLATRDQLVQLENKVEAMDRRLSGRIDDLRTVLFAGVAFNLAGFLGVAAFLYAVLKHA